ITARAGGTLAPFDRRRYPCTVAGELDGQAAIGADGRAPDRELGDTRRLLDEGVWVHIAWEPDPTDASVFTVQPDDTPILEAYAMANEVNYQLPITNYQSPITNYQLPVIHPIICK
ncbi:MAG: hypothetical protein ACKPA8_14910, partial [Dolichospermum sp.]